MYVDVENNNFATGATPISAGPRTVTVGESSSEAERSARALAMLACAVICTHAVRNICY